MFNLDKFLRLSFIYKKCLDALIDVIRKFSVRYQFIILDVVTIIVYELSHSSILLLDNNVIIKLKANIIATSLSS
jgi:hypothetical protein